MTETNPLITDFKGLVIDPYYERILNNSSNYVSSESDFQGLVVDQLMTMGLSELEIQEAQGVMQNSNTGSVFTQGDMDSFLKETATGVYFDTAAGYLDQYKNLAHQYTTTTRVPAPYPLLYASIDRIALNKSKFIRLLLS